jgi:hypothetical protein
MSYALLEIAESDSTNEVSKLFISPALLDLAKVQAVNSIANMDGKPNLNLNFKCSITVKATCYEILTKILKTIRGDDELLKGIVECCVKDLDHSDALTRKNSIQCLAAISSAKSVDFCLGLVNGRISTIHERIMKKYITEIEYGDASSTGPALMA